MKLALTADWLSTYGGAEHVVAVLAELWPDSPIVTTVAEPKKLPSRFGEGRIRVSRFLQFGFDLFRRHQIFLPWMPERMENVDFGGYDIVFSSSHAVGKGVIPPSSAVHVCYCHTPMRYAWEMEEEYLKDFRLRGFLRRLVKRELKHLRRWDLSTAKRTDHFIANSSETQARIRRIYGRESVVISPPVDAHFFDAPFVAREPYFLALGRLVPYKRFDLLIDLANRVRLPLKIGGRGSEYSRLKALAGPTVEFLGHVEDKALPDLYLRATALLFPQVEDAGIVPLESLSCGTPVIAYGKGGIGDVVEESVTGILATEQTVESFTGAVARFKANTWDHARIREYARKFHIDEFKRRIREEVMAAYDRFHQ